MSRLFFEELEILMPDYNLNIGSGNHGEQTGRMLIALEDVQCIEPVGYLDVIELERNALSILIDSGGVQKKAFWLRVPCITLRDETEWVETVRYSWNRLVGTDKEKMIEDIRDLRPGEDINFTNEFAAPKMCDIISSINRRG